MTESRVTWICTKKYSSSGFCCGLIFMQLLYCLPKNTYDNRSDKVLDQVDWLCFKAVHLVTALAAARFVDGL
ncbi:hypothetical protein AAIO74_05780 [Escherichia coli]|uniref:hypothetical protein n=1 Tax=Escherichia coli TaxID=562 RepID=UPI003D79F767